MSINTERSRSIPPPPPPIEDEQLTVEYGNMVNTYSNNRMADDESVEAQHVVYTFAEESGKTAKKSRKRTFMVMFTCLALLSLIVALGVVYGLQRQNRDTMLETNQSVEDPTLATGDAGSTTEGGASGTTDSLPEVDLDTEDRYDTPGSNSTDLEDELDELVEDEDGTLPEGENVPNTTETNSTTPAANQTDADESTATSPPTIWSSLTSSTGTTGTSSSSTTWTGTDRPWRERFPGFQGGQGQGGFQGGQGQGGFQGGQGGFQGGQGQGGFQGGQGQGGFQGGQGQGGFQGGPGQGQGGFGGAGQGQGGFRPGQGQGGQGGQGQGGFRPGQGGQGQGGQGFRPGQGAPIVVNDGGQAIGRDEPIENENADNVFGI